jgi:RHS repeat-associated protein
MKERSWQSDGYRYGFNGKENDSDWEVQDYGFRIYKPEISKFLSVDPLTQSYPWYTPYQFAGNQPIWAIDLDGLEEARFDILNDWNAASKLAKTDEEKIRIYNSLHYPHNEGLKKASNAAFKNGFNHYLPQKLIDHYSYGNGKPYTLTKQEMIDTNPEPMGIGGLTTEEQNKHYSEVNSMKVGEKRLISREVLGGSNTSGALGKHFVLFVGVLIKTGDSPIDWTFEGHMQFTDVWDFDARNDRPWGAEFLVGTARVALMGKGFTIRSVWVPVKQKGDEVNVDWFEKEKTSTETIPNAVVEEITNK